MLASRRSTSASFNAVYANKIAERPEEERATFVQELRDEFDRDVDVYKLASELVVDAIVPGSALREELVRRLAMLEGKRDAPPAKRHGVHPV